MKSVWRARVHPFIHKHTHFWHRNSLMVFVNTIKHKLALNLLLFDISGVRVGRVERMYHARRFVVYSFWSASTIPMIATVVSFVSLSCVYCWSIRRFHCSFTRLVINYLRWYIVSSNYIITRKWKKKGKKLRSTFSVTKLWLCVLYL